MKLLDGLKTRRSIRKYKNIKIELNKIKQILKLAIMAPSAHNSNPWYFLIIENKIIRKDLAIKMAEKYLKDLKNDDINDKFANKIINDSIEKFSESPTLIIPCLDMSKMQKYTDKKRQQIELHMGIQSIAAAIQNLLLAAHAEGIASCWYCAPLFAQNIIKHHLKIPNGIDPQAFITLGYPLSKKPAKVPPRVKISEICFLNKWGEKC